MTTVWFIRHGESEANAGLPTQHPVTTPLTAKGHAQAQQVAQLFSEAPDLIVASPYRRAQQTAQHTRDKFPAAPYVEWPVQEFTYLSPTHYQNSTIEQRRPLSDQYWQTYDPDHVDGEGAESFANLLMRVEITQTKMQQLGEDWAVVFSHGRFIRAMLWAALTGSTQASSKRMKQFHSFISSFAVPNGSILKVQLQHGEIWFNGIETAHLTSIESPSTPPVADTERREDR